MSNAGDVLIISAFAQLKPGKPAIRFLSFSAFGVSIAALILSTWTGSAMAEGKSRGKIITGWVERVTFPDHDIVVKAKLDTGAQTSSIYAKDIKPFERKGEKWVRFDLFLEDIEDDAHRITLERPLSRKVRIKEHDGKHDRRPVVEIAFCFNEQVISSEFTLTDRNAFLYSVLLGREFLAGRVIVDADKTFLLPARCPPSKDSAPELDSIDPEAKQPGSRGASPDVHKANTE